MMKLRNALEHFQVLASTTDNKRERKTYHRFTGIFTDLNHRNLTDEQIQSIEEKMEELELQMASSNSKKSLKRKLSVFTKYLQQELSLVTEGYYTALGLTFGVALGVALSPMLERQLGISINMGIGMILGVVVGHYLDTKAAEDNRVLRTKLG